jgi:acyl-CoA synthetase (AMP-forming)/AMP-acid ligase II
VIAGYENNPNANETSFFDGWFRTGDQGYLDAAGYLFLAGRLKEIINRGGEKIVPLEIDEALMAMPDVQQAVAFARPHPSLGEDLAAAVVLAPGSIQTPETPRSLLSSWRTPGAKHAASPFHPKADIYHPITTAIITPVNAPMVLENPGQTRSLG